MQALDGPGPQNPTECDGLKAAARDWAAAVEEIRRQTGRQQFYMLNSLLLRMPAPNSKSQSRPMSLLSGTVSNNPKLARENRTKTPKKQK